MRRLAESLSEQPGLETAFDALVETRLGRDPMNEDVVWTDLQPFEIVAKLNDQGFAISKTPVRDSLKKEIRKRTPVKSLATDEVDPERCNAQFENIAQLRADYRQRDYRCSA